MTLARIRQAFAGEDVAQAEASEPAMEDAELFGSVMRRARFRAALVLLTLLSACTALPQTRGPAGAALRPSDVVREVRALEGREVRVRGYLAFGSHARILWDSEAAARGVLPEGVHPLDLCLTLIDTLRHRRALTRNRGRIVTLRGVVRANILEGRVDFGACSDTGLQLSARRPFR